jgi:hypothetical protein
MEIYQQKISAYLEHSKSPQLLAGWTHISICSLSVKHKDATAQTLTLCFSIRTMSATIITGLAVPNCATLIKRASTRCSNNNTVHGTTISEHETNDKMPHSTYVLQAQCQRIVHVPLARLALPIRVMCANHQFSVESWAYFPCLSSVQPDFLSTSAPERHFLEPICQSYCRRIRRHRCIPRVCYKL